MGSTPKPPEPPPFFPIDIPSTVAQAIQYDTAGYNTSDADFAARFPGLVASRDFDIKQAYNQLTGPLDPTVQNTFTQQGVVQALQATGGGSNVSGITKGGFSGNTAGASIANSVLQKQDYDRSYFEGLLAANPERAFGLSGSDVANLEIANTGGLNASNQQQYQSTLNGIYAQGAAGVQTGQAISAIGGTLGGLSGLLGKYNTGLTTTPSWQQNAASDARLKYDIEKIGESPLGYEIVEFNYKPNKGLPKGRFRGVIAQQVLQIRPEAVRYESDGYMTVDYTMLDVKHEKV